MVVFNWCVISINATLKKNAQRNCSEVEEDDPTSVVDSSFKFLHSDDNNEEDNSTDVDESELGKDTASKEIDVENGENITQHPVGNGSSSSSSSKKLSSSGSSAKTQIEVGRKDDTDEDVALSCDKKTENTKELENKDTNEELVEETYSGENENRLNQMVSKNSSYSFGTSTPKSKSSTKECIPQSLKNIFSPLSSDKQNRDKDSVEEEVFGTVPEPDRSKYHKFSWGVYASEENGNECDEISSRKAEGPVSSRSTPSSGLGAENRRRKSTSSNSSSSNCSETIKGRESHEKPPIPPAESQTGKSSKSNQPYSRRTSSSGESELSYGQFSRKKGKDHSGSLSNNRSPSGVRPSSAGSADGLEKIKTALRKVLNSTIPAGRGSSTSREKPKSGSRRISIDNEGGQVSSEKITSDDSPSSFSVDRHGSAKVVTVELKDDFVEEVRAFYKCLDVHFTFGCSLRDDDHLSILSSKPD